MSAEFVDTNILIYAHDASAGSRQAISGRILERLTSSGNGVVSVQVLTEFYAVTTGKRLLPPEEAEAIIRDFGSWMIHRPNHADLLIASELHRRYAISWWDALIVHSAGQMGCEILWTENLNHDQQYGGVTVRNPFRG
jgi:predicted nucleic acid-binding protein